MQAFGCQIMALNAKERGNYDWFYTLYSMRLLRGEIAWIQRNTGYFVVSSSGGVGIIFQR